MSQQEIREALKVKAVLCWSEDEHRFATVNLPARQIRLLEEKFSGRLVEDPGTVRELHHAFVQFFKEKGRPPEVVRHVNLPLDVFHYQRVGINTPKGHQATSLNVYFRARRAIIAA